MQTPPRAAEVARAAYKIDWKAIVLLDKNTGTAFEILAILAAFGLATVTNQQLAVSLQCRGDVAPVNFQLYARTEVAAFIHNLISLCPVLTRPGAPFHDPAEYKRLALLAVDEFVAMVDANPPLAAAPTGTRTAQDAQAQDAQHASGAALPDADAPPAGEQTGQPRSAITPARTRAMAHGSSRCHRGNDTRRCRDGRGDRPYATSPCPRRRGHRRPRRRRRAHHASPS